MVQNEIKIRVRYGETDRMGYAHHSVYALYIEEGRTELLRELGMDYKGIEDKGFIMPVSSLEIQFKRPAIYDEVLTIVSRLKEKPGVRVDFEYEIYSEEAELLCTAKTRLVFANAVTGKPCRPMTEFLKIIEPYF
jgi:acyl-CoA thioester hydrolase